MQSVIKHCRILINFRRYQTLKKFYLKSLSALILSFYAFTDHDPPICSYPLLFVRRYAVKNAGIIFETFNLYFSFENILCS